MACRSALLTGRSGSCPLLKRTEAPFDAAPSELARSATRRVTSLDSRRRLEWLKHHAVLDADGDAQFEQGVRLTPRPPRRGVAGAVLPVLIPLPGMLGWGGPGLGRLLRHGRRPGVIAATGHCRKIHRPPPRPSAAASQRRSPAAASSHHVARWDATGEDMLDDGACKERAGPVVASCNRSSGGAVNHQAAGRVTLKSGSVSFMSLPPVASAST